LMNGLPSRALDNVSKICVLRSNSLGDYLFSLPALEALRSAYPRAEITLLGKPWHAQFLAGRPGPVDRVFVLPFVTGIHEWPGGTENPAETENCLAGLRHERFDIAVQLYGGGKYSNPFISKIGARLTVGMKAHDADPLERWVPYHYYFSEVLRYLEVVGLAGATPVTLAPKIEVTAEDRAEAEQVFKPGKPFALLHPGATDTRRRWPEEKFAQVGRALLEEGHAVCITGTTDEEAVCARVATAAPGAVNLFGRLSLGGLTGLLADASVAVANDTGPLHLARAAGAPTVAIYWIGNYINAPPPDMLRHRSQLSWRLECPACGTNCIESSCPHRDSFVAEIEAEAVRRSAFELLALT
jgi:ADP-heptose:LPS heptosyltransferase